MAHFHAPISLCHGGPSEHALLQCSLSDMDITVKPRRKPSQSRARMTYAAIQDAFFLVLLEKGYEKTSMRDISNVAGEAFISTSLATTPSRP